MILFYCLGLLSSLEILLDFTEFKLIIVSLWFLINCVWFSKYCLITYWYVRRRIDWGMHLHHSSSSDKIERSIDRHNSRSSWVSWLESWVHHHLLLVIEVHFRRCACCPFWKREWGTSFWNLDFDKSQIN